MNFSIFRFDSIDSTNVEALKQARLGADEGVCIVARQQTAGRGRQGRSWTSPPDAGLYLSIILRPKLESRYLPLITLAAAVAAFDTLAELEIEPDIKWPNDILVNERKICGILAETVDTNEGLAVVVGIGINLTSASFPPDVAETATSVYETCGQTISFSDLEGSLLDRLGLWYGRLCDHAGPADILEEWTKRSSYATGKEVRATIMNTIISGTTDGLESNGALRIVTADGLLHVIHAGDVEKLRRAE